MVNSLLKNTIFTYNIRKIMRPGEGRGPLIESWQCPSKNGRASGNISFHEWAVIEQEVQRSCPCSLSCPCACHTSSRNQLSHSIFATPILSMNMPFLFIRFHFLFVAFCVSWRVASASLYGFRFGVMLLQHDHVVHYSICVCQIDINSSKHWHFKTT